MSWHVNTWIIERGGDHQIAVHLLDVENVLPINISGASAISLLLKNADGTTLAIPADQGMACGLGNTLWIYSFPITAAQSALLPVVQRQVVEIEVFWGAKIQKYIISSSFSTMDPAL